MLFYSIVNIICHLQVCHWMSENICNFLIIGFWKSSQFNAGTNLEPIYSILKQCNAIFKCIRELQKMPEYNVVLFIYFCRIPCLSLFSDCLCYVHSPTCLVLSRWGLPENALLNTLLNSSIVFPSSDATLSLLTRAMTPWHVHQLTIFRPTRLTHSSSAYAQR